MEDQAVRVVGDVGERQFRLSAGKADGADEETEADLLVREHMLDGSPNGRLLRIGLPHRSRHRFARWLASVDAVGQHPFRQPLLILPRTIGVRQSRACRKRGPQATAASVSAGLNCHGMRSSMA
ncbi:MAG: hypothetical protein V7704_23440, partial [Aurantimonas endophytica]|uniref:hypothetical protein n=1 Tax=Aurantimonas endophytica TaxID=1522175 RepID=UPI003001214B